MGDVLSQNEIDSLLAALSSGELDVEDMQEKDEKEYHEAIENLIARAQIPVKAVLGTSTISVNEFVNLQRGDIIRLDTKVDQELNVYVGNIRKFTALPGASGDEYAVRVTSIIREEQ